MKIQKNDKELLNMWYKSLDNRIDLDKRIVAIILWLSVIIFGALEFAVYQTFTVFLSMVDSLESPLFSISLIPLIFFFGFLPHFIKLLNYTWEFTIILYMRKKEGE